MVTTVASSRCRPTDMPITNAMTPPPPFAPLGTGNESVLEIRRNIGHATSLAAQVANLLRLALAARPVLRQSLQPRPRRWPA